MNFASSSKVRKWMVGCFGIILLCGVGAVFLSLRVVDIFSRSAELDKLVEEAKRKGVPFEAKDMARSPHLAPSENAQLAVAKMARELGDSLEPGSTFEGFVPVRGKKIPPNIARVVAKSKDIARFKSYESGHDLDLSKFDPRPEDALYQTMGLALYESASQKACDLDIDGAIEDLKTLEKLASQLQFEHSLTGANTTMVLTNYFTTAEMNIGHFCTNSAYNLSKLRFAIPDELPLPSYVACMNGNFYRYLAFIRNEKYFAKLKDRDEVDLSRVKRTGMPAGIAARARLATLLRLLLKMQDISKSEPNLSAASKKMNKYLDNEPNTISNIAPMKWLHPVAISADRWELYQLRHRIFIRSLDLLRSTPDYVFPNTLETAPDTLATGDLIYRKNNHGFALYSRGKNGRDDGGPKSGKLHASSDDLGFEINFK